jgi:hypothetical protein
MSIKTRGIIRGDKWKVPGLTKKGIQGPTNRGALTE